MKILLAHKYFNLTGGAEVFFFETGRVLEANGHEVAYFSTTDPDNQQTQFAEYFVDAPEYSSGNIVKRALGLRQMIYSKDAKKQFARLIADTQPDLVHVFAIHVHLSPSILVAAHEAGVPVVMSCNDYKHICPNYKLYHHERICTDCKGKRFYKAISNRCCKKSLVFSVASSLEAYAHNYMDIYHKYVHTYLFASEFMARETERFWGADSFRWDTLRNPFDSRKFPLSEADDDYALFFGRLVDEKGVDILVRAMASARDVKLKIVGSGPDEEKLLKLTMQLGLQNVEFLGPKWGDELDSILSLARFVVVPSVWHENFPYVINQSFAFGKAVIGSDRGGIPELVSHGVRGLIYPAHDESALAAAMTELWNDPEQAKQMGKAAKVFSDDEFNDERFYERLISVYDGVLNESSGSRG